MADDAASLVVQIRADQSRFTKEMSKIARDAARAADRVEKGFQSANSRAGTSFNKIGTSAQSAFRQAERGATSFSAKLDGISRKMETLGTRGGGLGSLVAGFAGGLAAGFSVQGARELLDANTRITNSLKVAGLEGQQLDKTFTDLATSAKRNGASFESLAQLYSRMALTSGELGISSQQLTGFVDKVAVAIRVAGTDSQASSGALLQLSQSMGSGALRGDEFNSVMEGLPTVMQAVARGLNVPLGSLKAMAAAGELTSRVVFDAFMLGSQQLEDQASRSVATFAQSFENVRTAMIEVAGRFNESTNAAERFAGFINGTVIPALQKLGDSAPKWFLKMADGMALVDSEFQKLVDNSKTLGEELGTNRFASWVLNSTGALGQALRDMGVTADLDGTVQGVEGVTRALIDVQKEVFALNGDFSDLTSEVSKLDPTLAQELTAAVEALDGKVEDGIATAEDFNAVINLLFEAGGEKATGMGEALQGVRDRTLEAQEAMQNALKPQVDALVTSLTSLGDTPMAVLDAMANKFGVTIPESIRATVTAIEQAGSAYNRMQDALQEGGEGRTERGDAAAFVAGGRQYPGDRSKAAAFIRQKESFQPRAYPDTRTSTGKFDAWRVGFGSDTYVDAMGDVQKVTKETMVTLEQANRDLDRRLGEFQATIQRQIGPEMWKSLDEGQQAALTSIAYNYGSLPKSIATAIKSGNSRGDVANAIASLTANPARRRDEAELYGGAGFSVPRGESRVKQESNDLDEWMAKTNQALALKEKENLIDKDMTATIDEKTAAKERAKLIDEGMAAAVKQYGTVTDEMKQKIIDHATALSNAGLAADQFKTKQEALAQSSKQNAAAVEEFNNQMLGITKTAFSGFVNDLRNGVSAGEAFSNVLDRVIDGLINMTIESMFAKNALGATGGGGGGLFGFLGKLFGIGMHEGGTVGQDATFARAVPRRAFVGAKRYQRGGVAGFAPGEVPIIAHKGEVIIPKGARTASAGTNVNAQTKIDVAITNGQGQSNVTSNQGAAFAQLLDKQVQQIMVRESRPGGLLKTARGAS